MSKTINQPVYVIKHILTNTYFSMDMDDGIRYVFKNLDDCDWFSQYGWADNVLKSVQRHKIIKIFNNIVQLNPDDLQIIMCELKGNLTIK